MCGGCFTRLSCDFRAPACVCVRLRATFVHLRATFVRPSCTFVHLGAVLVGDFFQKLSENPLFGEFCAKSAQNREYGNAAVFREFAARIWPFAFWRNLSPNLRGVCSNLDFGGNVGLSGCLSPGLLEGSARFRFRNGKQSSRG